MKQTVFFLLFLLPAFLIHAQPIKLMLVTGGHAFDTIQYFELFDELEGIEYEHFQQPFANAKIAKDLAKDFDVLVFYDMWEKIKENEKEAYLKLTKLGKPLLFLHHSIVSYQNWPEFEQIVGGKYIKKNKGIPEDQLSNFEHDVWVYSKVENYTPVTNGFKELRFFDEVYGNVRVSESVTPLLRTTHPKSMPIIAWQHKFNNSKIVYIQPGHDKRTYVEKDYQKLLLQAIKYLVE